MTRKFDALTNLQLVEFKVPVICPSTACVPGRSAARYLNRFMPENFMTDCKWLLKVNNVVDKVSINELS